MKPKTKVLLVYPGDKWSVATFPLGLLYVAQALRSIDVETAILHLALDDFDPKTCGEYLFVGISMLTGQTIAAGLRLAKKVKDRNKDIPIVLGGVHPSLVPEESLQHPLVDIVVIGEGEETVKDLTTALLDKRDLSTVKGIAYKTGDGKIMINAPRELIDLNTLDPDLPYHLLGNLFSHSNVLPIHTSRGCPYRCAFCYSPAFNKRRYRCKSAQRVVDEIEQMYKKHSIRCFNFDSEDEFFIDPVRVSHIFQGVIDRGLKIRWTTFCRFDTFYRSYKKYGQGFVDLIKASGCHFISFGGESGSQRLLDTVIKKDITVEQIAGTVEVLKKNKIIHRVTFINGFPGETEDDLKATRAVINTITEGNDYIYVAMLNLVPLPGTEIFDILKSNRVFTPPSSLEEWGRYVIPRPLSATTWLPKRHVRLCRAQCLMGTFPYYKNIASYRDYREYVRLSGEVYPQGCLAYLLTRVQRMRDRTGFFLWMVEVPLYNLLTRIRSQSRNYLVSFLKKRLSSELYKAMKRFLTAKTWTSEKNNDGGGTAAAE